MKKISLFIIICFTLSWFSVASGQGFSDNKTNNFLVFTDIHLDYTAKRSMDIQPSGQNIFNDLDPSTFEKLVAQVDRNIKSGVIATPKFILLMGDLVGHIRSAPDSALQSESAVFNLLKKTFPSTPIFYTFGNNDSLKVNYGPFTDPSTHDRVNSPYEVAVTHAGWLDGFLSTGMDCVKNNNTYPCMLTEDKTNGYYAAYLEPKLRLISINTVMFSPRYVQTNEQDTTNQLKWLEAQLAEARQKEESVMMTMHVPPGYNIYDHMSFWGNKEKEGFLAIVSTYQDTIIGMLASHTHYDELKVVKDKFNKPIAGVYLTAALSTMHGNAPSVKTFYYGADRGRWTLTNYDAFGFSVLNNNLVFNKLYDYRQYYCDARSSELTQCLSQVTAEKIKKYFSAGNPNFSGKLESPEDVFLDVLSPATQAP